MGVVFFTAVLYLLQGAVMLLYIVIMKARGEWPLRMPEENKTESPAEDFDQKGSLNGAAVNTPPASSSDQATGTYGSINT